MASIALEEKINKIRQQNEEIRRRHEEVEADKQNAAKLNALVQMVPSTDWPERKEPPEFIDPVPKNNFKPKTSTREHRGIQQQYHPGGGEGKRTHVFAVGDGPPPDPSYNFLADSEREERAKDDNKDGEKFKGRDPRGGPRKRGMGRSQSFKEHRGPGIAPRDLTKPEYEAWRAERNRIDEARISRQRTAEGNWRREWDNNKINIEEDGTGKAGTRALGDVRKDFKEFEKWPVDGGIDYEASRGRGGRHHVARGASRGVHNNRGYHHSTSFEYHGPVSPSFSTAPLSPTGIDERTVLATDKSLKVIVNHGPTSPKGPVMSVKVSPASIAGTGRVGPRQKPRVLYSSQADNDAMSNEHEKYSGYKSADDKPSRGFYNRDGNDQVHYGPKSPRSHQKTDSSPKSPYLPRREFNKNENPVSVHSQRLGENDPWPQHHPKSPHFQKRVDFADRDPATKHISDATKSPRPQKKMFDKTKTKLDASKVPPSPKSLTNKFEKKSIDDGVSPRPQRIAKRSDRSHKSVQNRISNEVRSIPNDVNNTQVEHVTADASPEKHENVPNGDTCEKATTNIDAPNEVKRVENRVEDSSNLPNDSNNVGPFSSSEPSDENATVVSNGAESSSAITVPDAVESSSAITVPDAVDKTVLESGSEVKPTPLVINTEIVVDSKVEARAEVENNVDVKVEDIPKVDESSEYNSAKQTGEIISDEAANDEEKSTAFKLTNGEDANNAEQIPRDSDASNNSEAITTVAIDKSPEVTKIELPPNSEEKLDENERSDAITNNGVDGKDPLNLGTELQIGKDDIESNTDNRIVENSVNQDTSVV